VLDSLKEKLISTLTAEGLKSTYGNRAAIEQERRSFYAEIVARLFPALQVAVENEISVVTNLVKLAEREVVLAADNAKEATGIVYRATETLLKSLDACHEAEARIVDSQNAVIRAEAALAAAKEEFAKLSERARG
jgi:hypothetical protein